MSTTYHALLDARHGWSVAILRKDGTSFLACAGGGVLPPVWPKTQRRHAVSYKRELLKAGFTCRVVPVWFADPREREPAARCKWSRPPVCSL